MDKPWYQSKTVWAVVCGVAVEAWTRLQANPAIQAWIQAHPTEVSLIVAVGGGLIVWFRKQASGSITLK